MEAENFHRIYKGWEIMATKLRSNNIYYESRCGHCD